jgi:D-glycero-D-manno-heptose 1,7-bisphosphate phosphatase
MMTERDAKSPSSRPAIFFDRDGVLIADSGYVHRPDQVAWQPGAFAAVRRFKDLGWLVFVVTNQSGIGRGFYDETDLRDLHRWMAAEMVRHGAHIDAFTYCPHHPEASLARYRRVCRCRKPAPGMIEALLAAWPVDRARSLLIGDRETDMAAARAAGVKAHHFSGGNLAEFVEAILSPGCKDPQEHGADCDP